MKQKTPDPHRHVELHPLTLFVLRAGLMGLAYVFLWVDNHTGESVSEWNPVHKPNKPTNKNI